MRCAIYTRKSSDEAPDSNLSSIETQRALCETFIASQAAEGWMALPDRYDDLGYSGGTIERPALARLLDDIAAGLIDTVVVYKIDRLSRSLRDFVNLIDLFDKAGVSFLSTTQQFSTTSSMGRLTLNILLTFAQFEREMAGERTRDWVAGARKRGIWTSGPPPFGYMRRDGRLAPHPERAEVVRWVFRRLPRAKCFGTVAHELNAAGHRNRFGRTFDGRTVKTMIENRVYLGEMRHRGEHIPGTHEPLVTSAMWRSAQKAVAEIRAGRYGQMGAWQRSRKIAAPVGLVEPDKRSRSSGAAAQP